MVVGGIKWKRRFNSPFEPWMWREVEKCPIHHTRHRYHTTQLLHTYPEHRFGSIRFKLVVLGSILDI